MRCEEIRNLMEEAITERLAPEARWRLEMHLVGCPACSERYFEAVGRQVERESVGSRPRAARPGLLTLLGAYWKPPAWAAAGILLGAVLAWVWLPKPKESVVVLVSSGEEYGLALVSSGEEYGLAIKAPDGTYEAQMAPAKSPKASEAQILWASWQRKAPGAITSTYRAREDAFGWGARLRALILADLPNSPYASDEARRMAMQNLSTGALEAVEWLRNRLYKEGFERVDIKGRMPETLNGLTPYHVVIFTGQNRSYSAPAAPLLEQYIAMGGGVVMDAGLPVYLSHHWTADEDQYTRTTEEQEKHPFNTDLSAISPWFGATWYWNNDNAGIKMEFPNVFGRRIPPSLPTKGAAGLDRVALERDPNSRIIARWMNDRNDVMAFCRNYKQGRVYYQALWGDDRRFHGQNLKALGDVFVAGILWAAGAFEKVEGPREGWGRLQ